MKSIFTALILFFMFMLMAIVSTAITYFVVYCMALYVCGSFFDIDVNHSWVPLAITLLFFVVSLIASIRKKVFSVKKLEWDSGLVMAPQSYWRAINPLGPNSVKSIVAIVTGFFCFGPGCMVSAFVTAINEFK